MIHTHAYARAGLIGNPSDGYFGKTISVILRNFEARVTCYESPRLSITPRWRDRLEFESVESLVEDVQLHGYYGGIRLVKAAIKRFRDYCREHEIHLRKHNFTIEYDTNIPVRVGLAGSSGIITATMRALMSFYGVQVPKPDLPNLILSVELDELGIGAGLQDRVIQVYEGVVCMDFNRKHMQQHGYGVYEPLDAKLLPPLFVAYHDNLAEGTEVTHNDLRSRYSRGDRQVLDGMTKFAELTQQARGRILAGQGATIGPLMDDNFNLREQLCRISEGNRRLIDIGRHLGASVKFAGSGGAVIGTYDGDPGRRERIKQAYERFGASFFIPEIEGEREGSDAVLGNE